MTTYYVGIGGADSDPGTSWGTRKLTLNGAENIPVVAGDTVYVGPGTYRELLTVDVAGTAGNPITYIGDYTGANTDNVGGLVRITGSDNDQTATRVQCINLPNARSYRTFTGFMLDTVTGNHIFLTASSTNLTVSNCCIQTGTSSGACIAINGTGGAHLIENCFILTLGIAIQFIHTSTVDDTASVVQNCIMSVGGVSQAVGVRVDRVGGITVRNCSIFGGNNSIRVQTALTVGQVLTVNNCICTMSNTALAATTTAEYVEDYNCLFGNGAARSNVTAGANSLAYPPLFEPRWVFQVLNEGAGPDNASQLITPFDLASFSQLLNVAGTSPTTTDMRGTSAIGGAREWGPLEIDTTLKIESGGNSVAASIFGTMVR